MEQIKATLEQIVTLLKSLIKSMDNKPMNESPKEVKKKLAVIVGHTKRAGGAWALAPISSNEYNYNTEVAKVMKLEGEKLGLDVMIFTRDSGGITAAYNSVRDWFLKPNMYSDVNKWADDNTCAIELHFNAATPRATGTETLYDIAPADSIDLAKVVQKNMVSVFRLADRGVKRRVKDDRGYYNLEVCKYPSVIVEPFFGSNGADATKGKKLMPQYAKCLVLAAKEFLG